MILGDSRKKGLETVRHDLDDILGGRIWTVMLECRSVKFGTIIDLQRRRQVIQHLVDHYYSARV